MPIIQWMDTFKVDIPEIDGHHQHLFELFNQLYDAIQRGETKEGLGKVINELLEYSWYHFSYEENLFDQYEYPDTAAHMAQHHFFGEKAQQFKSDLLENKIGLVLEVTEFLSDWLKNHIIEEDHKYVPFFSSKGLS